MILRQTASRWNGISGMRIASQVAASPAWSAIQPV